MTVAFFLNNALTFRGARLKGWRIVRGLTSFYLACSIGMWINLKMAHAAGALGAEWYTAGLLGLGVSSIWNYGITQMFTWREGRKRISSRASIMPPALIPAVPGTTQSPSRVSEPASKKDRAHLVAH